MAYLRYPRARRCPARAALTGKLLLSQVRRWLDAYCAPGAGDSADTARLFLLSDRGLAAAAADLALAQLGGGAEALAAADAGHHAALAELHAGAADPEGAGTWRGWRRRDNAARRSARLVPYHLRRAGRAAEADRRVLRLEYVEVSSVH